EVGIEAPLLGADGWDGVLTVVEDASVLEGYYFCNHYSVEDTDETVQGFLKNYEAKYGETPNAFSALGYDAAKILFTALETAGTTDSAAVVEAMKNTNLNGVTGNITFDDHRDPQKSVAISRFVDGQAKLIKKMMP
ncbi:MAG: ABC transporter substrate-binding protein, partial [Clostridiales bacterium]|nr:ABC transporter substrate-binding protein [Clostridiales bacterium]